MPKITAILHARNDAARLGRAIESLRPCDEIIVIDHDSNDESGKVAREHGALVKSSIPGVQPGAYVIDARFDWILCLQPCESLTEGLEASLFEWKEQDEPGDDVVGYRFAVRAEQDGGWKNEAPELRLVNRGRLNWPDDLPPNNPKAPELPGDLLRFEHP